MQWIYRRAPIPKCDLKSHFGVSVLRKFAANLQNTFFQEHLWVAASDNGRSIFRNILVIEV